MMNLTTQRKEPMNIEMRLIMFVEYICTSKHVLHSACACCLYILSLLRHSDLNALRWSLYLLLTAIVCLAIYPLVCVWLVSSFIWC